MPKALHGNKIRCLSFFMQTNTDPRLEGGRMFLAFSFFHGPDSLQFNLFCALHLPGHSAGRRF
jgi:hypothetical protein